MVGLGFKQTGKSVRLLLLQLTLLVLTLTGLSFTGLAVDVLLHAVDATKSTPRWPLGLEPTWLKPMHQIWLIAGAVLLFAATRALLRNQLMISQARLIQSMLADLRAQVYDKMQRLSFRFFDGNESGSIINRTTRDVAAVATFAEWAIIQMVVLLITLCVNLAYMSQIHGWLTIVALSTTPLLIASSIFYSKIVRPAYEKNRELYDRLVLTLSENVQGHHVIEGFALHEEEIAKFKQRNQELRDQQQWLFKRAAFYTAFVHMLTQTNLIIVLSYGGYLVIQGELTVGSGLWVFMSLMQSFSAQVTALANVADTLQQSLTSAQRVYEVLETPLEIANKPDAQRMPKLRGHVQFESIGFEFKPGEPVLDDISLEVEPGQCVAIMGVTGSGKSTLLSLIPRFYDPTRGRILIDGIDIRDMYLDDLRRNIGLVFQESFLFSNTVAANISFGHPTATREEIERAAKVAAAHDFIMDLPNGYDTVIGEQGSNLSGGQRQRLAIARAVLLEPSILLLDDATAAIDPETEHEILQAMDNVMKGRTTFVVANRLSTLRRADMVIVLDKGRIVQVGTHQELVKAEGQYRQVARLQGIDSESKRLLGLAGGKL